MCSTVVREFNEKMRDMINKLKELPECYSNGSLSVDDAVQLEHIVPIAYLRTLEAMPLNNANHGFHEFVAEKFCTNQVRAYFLL